MFMFIFVDGTRLIAAVGNRVLLYDAESGNLLESLKGLVNIICQLSKPF